MFQRLILCLLALLLGASAYSCTPDSTGGDAPVDDTSDDPSPDTAIDDVVEDLPSSDTPAEVDAEQDADGSGDVSGDTDPAGDVVDVDNDPADAAPVPLELTGVTAVANPSNALSYFVLWSTSLPTATTTSLVCDEQILFEWADPELAVDRDLFVWGTYPGAECELQITVTDSEERSLNETVPLPAGAALDFMPELTQTIETPSPSEGWTMIGLNQPGTPWVVAIVDEDGRYRWYHEVSPQSGTDNMTRIVDEGILLSGRRSGIRPQIIDWDGSQLWMEPVVMHHDARVLREPDRLAYLIDDDFCERGIAEPGGIDIIDMQTREIVWQWRICEHVEPLELVPDWAHLNTIEPVESLNAFLVSSREQHQVYAVDMESGEVLWTLGQRGDFELSEGAEFLRQHAPEWEDGRVLLFDNGNVARGYSRAIELELDLEEMTATLVWEWRPEPDIYADIWGDADRLPNGNRLINFGRRGAELDSHTIEVDIDGNEVWHLVFPPSWGSYRAERFVPPPLIMPREL